MEKNTHELTLATWDHDRCMPLHDGQVSVPGVDFESHILPTGKLSSCRTGGAFRYRRVIDFKLYSAGIPR